MGIEKELVHTYLVAADINAEDFNKSAITGLDNELHKTNISLTQRSMMMPNQGQDPKQE